MRGGYITVKLTDDSAREEALALPGAEPGCTRFDPGRTKPRHMSVNAASAEWQEMFPTVAEKAAALLHSLICTHPFLDANKRTAWAAARVFAMLNGLELTLSHDEAFDLVLHLAQSCQDNDIKGIAGALEGS